MYTFKYLSFLSIVRIVNPLKQGLRPKSLCVYTFLLYCKNSESIKTRIETMNGLF